MRRSNFTSRFVSRLGASIALTFVALAVSTGCEPLGIKEHCSESGVYECRDNHVWLCCPEDSVWEDVSDCGSDVCVEEGSDALCATSEEPDPRCENVPTPSSDASRGFCADNAAFRCSPGDHVERGPSCNADPEVPESEPETCVEADGQAFCAESALPEPACQWTTRDVVCGERGLIWCTLGYAVGSRACDTRCIEGAEFTFCPPTAEPDPACVGDSFCEGTSVVNCTEGYRMDSYACDARCVAPDGNAQCASPVDPRCAPTGESNYCDGSAVVHCDEGTPSWREYCAPAACDDASGSAECVVQK